MEIVQFDSKISWTIAVACACMNFLIMIPTKLSGLFFVEILDRYQVGRNLAGYPVFIISLVRCSGGPFTGYFAERFGVNEVLILGSILGGLGVAACFFAEDIAAVIILFGIVHGFGVAFNHTLIPLIVKVCFKKHLTLAYGVTQAGSAFGAFLASPLLLLIFQSYLTSGGFLITGAIMFNLLPIAMVLKMLVPNKCYGKSDDAKKYEACPGGQLEMDISNTENSSEDKVIVVTFNIGNKTENHVKEREENVSSQIKNSLEEKISANLTLNSPTQFPSKIGGEDIDPFEQLILCGTLKEQSEKNNVCLTKQELAEKCGAILEIETKYDVSKMEAKGVDNKKINVLENNLKDIPFTLMDTQEKKVPNKCEENRQYSTDYSLNSKYKSTAEMKDEISPYFQVKDNKNCHPTKDSDSNTSPCGSVLVNHENTLHQETTERDEIFPPIFKAENARCLEYNKSINLRNSQKEVFETGIKPSLIPAKVRSETAKKSFIIFLDITYWAVIIANSCYIWILVMFYATMIDFSRDKQIDRSKEVYLLMTLPISELIGRLGLGWINDSSFISKTNLCTLCFIGMGCCCSFMAMAQELFFAIVSIVGFGIISSGLMVTLPMIVFEFFDPDKYTMGQASKTCLFGPLSFLNGPMLGYFRGTLGSYDWLYHTLALVSLTCAALTSLVPVLARMRDEKKKKFGS